MSKYSFAFGGAMYAWPYQFGVARYLQEHDLVRQDSRIYSASAGSLSALLLLCGVDMARGTAATLVSVHDQRRIFGRPPYVRPAKMRQCLDWILSLLPADAHRRVSGRLFVTMMRLPTLRRFVVSDFPDPDTLIEVMLATMSLPFHSVWLGHRSHRLGWCLDGAFLGPTLDERSGWETLRISAIARRDGPLARFREADISPSPPIPLRQVLFPGTVRQQLALLKRGYRDATAYFHG